MVGSAPDDTAGVRPTQRQRLRFYIEPLIALDEKRFPIDREKTLVTSARQKFEVSMEASAGYSRRWQNIDPERLAGIAKRYWSPLVAVHRKLDIKRRFQMVLGDHVAPSRSPAFHKVRMVEGAGLDVIAPLNRGRHFGYVGKVGDEDVVFERKRAQIVWRGATTGRFEVNRPPSRFYIYKDWQRWSGNSAFDFGFVALTGDAPRFEALHPGAVADHQVAKLSLADQLQAKYLLCLEGNDVASGLKWMLASNSIVIMPRPTVVSWACESFLAPGVHYVEVNHDLSNLEEVYDWCEANPRICKEISQNGKAFMEPFHDQEQESALFEEVVRRYHRRIRLYDPDKQKVNADSDA